MLEVWTMLKATEVIPAAWKYKCVVCWLVIDIAPHFIENWATFFSCPISHAWDEWGPKWPHEDVWEYLG